MKTLRLLGDYFSSSDEYDYQPEYVDLTWNPELVKKARQLVIDNPWVEAVKVSEDVDFEPNASYEGKARGGHLMVYQSGVDFKFHNDWTNTKYNYDLGDAL